jgi:flagellar hook assembly protein FlgD
LSACPNPFIHKTVIQFVVVETPDMVSLQIHDLTGRVVQAFDLTNHQSPFNQITWDGTDRHGKDVAPGIYFCKLRAGEHTITKKMFLAR